MFVCTPWGRGWCLWIPEEGISAPGTRVTIDRELPSECQDLNPSPLQEQEVVFTAESALQPFSVQEASAAHTQLTLSSQTQPLSLLCQRQCPQTVPVIISPSSSPTALHSSGWPQMCGKFPASAWQLSRTLGLSPYSQVSPTLSVLNIPTSHLTLCFLFSVT